jgi:hypothetical protein
MIIALVLSAAGAPAADFQYRVQPLLALDEAVGDGSIRAQVAFGIDSLNNNGQLLFRTLSPQGDVLLQYSGGQVTPVIVPGSNGPAGPWPIPLGIAAPAHMNQNGSIVFSASDVGKNRWTGVFIREAGPQKITPVALPGSPAADGRRYSQTISGSFSPAINSSSEVVFNADVGQPSVFRLGRDGQILPIAAQGTVLTGTRRAGFAFTTSINDQGAVGFIAGATGENATSAYVWENGAITQVAKVNSAAPGGGRIIDTNGAWVNNKNRNVLVWAVLQASGRPPHALYLWTEGTLAPVAVHGQEMPGGGTFDTLEFTNGTFCVSHANNAGQHAFLAAITEGGQSSVGAYLMDADGKLSLIVKNGSPTDLGPITKLGGSGGSQGISLNDRGQVALPLRISGGPTTAAILTPIDPQPAP